MTFNGNLLRALSLEEGNLSETEHREAVVPAHAHDFASFCLVTYGEMREMAAGRDSTHVCNDVVFRRPAERHANVFRDRVRCFNVLVHPTLFSRAGLGPANLRAASSVLRRLRYELRSDGCTLVAEGLLYELVGQTFRERQVPRSLVDEALKIIESRFPAPLTLRSIAKELDAHPVHVGRAFRDRRGMTVAETIRSMRVRYAMDLLRDPDLSLATIATSTGFADQSHFTKCFRRATGMTPGRYRTTITS